MRPDADKAWFKITISGGPKFDVYSISGSEGISTLYSYEVALVNKDANVSLPDLVGKDACLTIKDVENSERVVHGVVREMNHLQTGNNLHHYSCIIVPRLWFLTETSDHRIYQDKTVVDIIKELLEEQGFPGDAYSFDKCTPPPPREYCVQYRESDYYFISRLCEEEGIFFYFDHSKSQHKLCFANVEGSSLPPVKGNPSFRFTKGSGTVAEKAVISGLELHHKTSSNKSTYREWNFSQAKLNLEVEKKETDPVKAPPMPIGDPDTYQYPYLYQDRGEGERYADLQVKRQIAANCWIDVSSDSSRFVPGFQFTIWGHKRADVNKPWVTFSLRLRGEQPGVLGDEAPGGGFFFTASVTAIPTSTRFVPENAHPKNRVIGQQAAIVVGEGNEEIYPDEHGRVKVQFFWDREGEWNEKSTCWIRVSQGWAGGQYGTMAIPRVGHEVLVSFLEGDPDRPIITGRVYHQLNKPPYSLPDNKTRTVFKSYSSPSTEHKGFNELRVEDKAKKEEIYVHAEKDVNVYVKNDWADNVCANRSMTTGGSTMLQTGGTTSVTLKKDRMSLLEKDDHMLIKGKRLTEIVGEEERKMQNLKVSSQNEIFLDAPKKITLRVGDSFIVIATDGITIQGPMIWENCGKEAGTLGNLTAPTAPNGPKGVDSGSVPDGGEMAKPMPPKKKQQESSSGSSAGGAPEAPSGAGAGAPGGGMGSSIIAGDDVMPTMPAATTAGMPGMTSSIVAGDDVMGLPGVGASGGGMLYAAAAAVATDAGGAAAQVQATAQQAAPAWDQEQALEHLRNNAQPQSIGRCARYVREAIEAGGVTLDRAQSAMNYGPSLENAGFVALEGDVVPMAGDVVVHQSPGTTHPDGHIAMFDGQAWISDFRQRDMFGGGAYRRNPNYTIYRRP